MDWIFTLLYWIAGSILLLASLASLASLLPFRGWVFRSADFPRLQLTVLLLVGGLGWTWYMLQQYYAWQWSLAGLGLLALLHQARRILPYTPLWPCEIKRHHGPLTARSLSLMVANVLTPNRRASELLKEVQHRAPQLLLTLETDAWWEEELEPLHEKYPYRVALPQDNLYGMHLYSQLPLRHTQVHHRIQADVPSIQTQVKLTCGHWVQLHSLHPRPPSPSEADSSLPRDAELLLVGRELEGNEDTAIVMGDLNDVAWSRSTILFRKLSALLDPRRGRGFFNTFHARYPLARWPLDHVFVSQDFRLRQMKRLPYFGSDHFPIYLSLEWYPRSHHRQEGAEQDLAPQDLWHARDTINEGRDSS